MSAAADGGGTAAARMAPTLYFGYSGGFWLMVVYLVLLPVAVWVLFCGDGSRVACVRWLNRVATTDVPHLFSRVATRLGFGVVVRALHAAEHYLLWTPNRIFQGFYLALVSGLFAGLWFGAVPELALAGFAPWHAHVLLAGAVAGLLIFCRVAFSDPGFVPTAAERKEDPRAARARGAALPSYDCDFILYDARACDTCGIESRPARSKHCRVCGRCVARYDHHCVWMNNCIGARNHVAFMLFLVHHSVLCFYGTYLAVVVVAAQVSAQVAHVRKHYSPGFSPSAENLLHFLALNAKGLTFTLVLTAAVAAMLGGFFAYHLLLVWRNTTTNETFKWDDVRSNLTAHFDAVTELEGLGMDTKDMRDSLGALGRAATGGDVGCTGRAAQRGGAGGDAVTAASAESDNYGDTDNDDDHDDDAAAAGSNARAGTTADNLRDRRRKHQKSGDLDLRRALATDPSLAARSAAASGGSASWAPPPPPPPPPPTPVTPRRSKSGRAASPTREGDGMDPVVEEKFRQFASGAVGVAALNLYNAGVWANFLEVLTGKVQRRRDWLWKSRPKAH
jgi:hypothetical protein